MRENSNPHLFVFAGEQSGDAHGSALLKALAILRPAMHIHGVAGPKMRQEKIEQLLPMEEFQVMGFSDVFKSLPKLLSHFRKIRKFILSRQPKAVLFIDYPGFNLRMAKSLRKGGYKGKLIHYICPSVWAWGEKRVPQMAATLDLLLSILPFEPAYFLKTSLKTIYVGNPSLEAIESYHCDPNFLSQIGLNPEKPILALFPGSRASEIKGNLNRQLSAAKLLQKEDPSLQIALSVANPQLLPFIQAELIHSQNKETLLVASKHTFDLMRHAKAAIATSGTVTLELALHKVPTIMVYAISPFNAFLAKRVYKINLPFYCLPNILSQKLLFPELIHNEFTIQNCYVKLREIYFPGKQRLDCIEGCNQLINLLENGEREDSALHKASYKAAATILELLKLD